MAEEKPKALVIDDDKELGLAFQAALELVGFETRVLTRGETALTYMREFKPILITLDLQMPHVSGADVLRSIRADEELKHIHVIMVTANGRAYEYGVIRDEADIVLLKPVTLDQIQDFAARIIQNHQK